jgi:hypothetical protein
MWPQGRPKDFERTGRRYVERATGVEFQLVRGNPLFGDDPEAADLFLVEDGSLWFLRRVDRPEALVADDARLGMMPAGTPVVERVPLELEASGSIRASSRSTFDCAALLFRSIPVPVTQPHRARLRGSRKAP